MSKEKQHLSERSSPNSNGILNTCNFTRFEGHTLQIRKGNITELVQSCKSLFREPSKDIRTKMVRNTKVIEKVGMSWFEI